MKSRSSLTIALMLATDPLGHSNLFSGNWAYTLNEANEATLTAYLGPGGAVEIPSNFDGKPVKQVGEGAGSILQGGSVISVIIPDSVTEIAPYAFANSSTLSIVTIPNSVTEVGTNAFANCTSLTNVTIPSSVATIEDNAFYGCTALTNLTIVPGMNLSWIGNAAFLACPIAAPVTVPLFTTVWPDAFPSEVVVKRDLGTLASALQSRPSRQTISLKVASKTKVGSSIPVRAIATSKLPVAVTSSDPDILRIVGSNALALTKGSVTLTATQEGNANFLPATPVTKSVTVE